METKNRITMSGIITRSDSGMILNKIDATLFRSGCTAQSFRFKGEKITTIKKRDTAEVRVTKIMKDCVRISVCLDGNQCIVGLLSPQNGNLMTAEQIARNIEPKSKPVQNLPEPSKDSAEKPPENPEPDNQGGDEETGERTQYSLKEIEDETFVGIFLIFLREFWGNDHTKVKTSTEISKGFNLSDACDSGRCLTPRRVAKILINLLKQGKIQRIQERPFGLYSLVPQENSASSNPVQKSKPQPPIVESNTADLLTTLLDRRSDLKIRLAELEAEMLLTREGLLQVDSEIKGVPKVMERYRALHEAVG